MFPFLIGTLGSALVTGGYVLLRTPRTGSENQKLMKELYTETKYNVENVQDKAGDLQAAVNNMKTEIAKLQVGVVPEVMNTVEDFQVEAQVYTRRINDSVEEINQEVQMMKNRINVKNDTVTLDDTDDTAK